MKKKLFNMQSVILAAGIGKRLKPLTDKVPKCLIPLGKNNLLHQTIENILHNGIKDFILVLGYKGYMIEEYVNKNFSEYNFRFLYNNDYENNNNSYSLWTTKNYINGSIILLDSDILFDSMIISDLLNSKHDNCLAVNFSKQLDEEQIKVIIDNDNKILKIGKDINIKKSAGESIGIEKFSSCYLNELFSILDRKIESEHIVNEFYEASFQEIINNNSRNSLYCIDVSKYRCMEIDTIEDYIKAKNLLT